MHQPTEAEVAQQLGISQQGVNKHKCAILRNLLFLLEGRK